MESYVGTLPAARMSPRILNGALKWYEGDTFELEIQLELTDQFGEAVELAPEHTITFLFFDARREPIYEVTFTEITDNTVLLRFTEGVTTLFPKGEYTYDVIYKGIGRRTLVNDAPVVVE